MLKHYWMSAVDLALLVFMLLTSLKIIGIDYSTGMLTVAKRRAAQAGIHHADFLHYSWEDNWDALSTL